MAPSLDSQRKRDTYRVYLDENAGQLCAKLASGAGISQSQLLSIIAVAGMRAIEGNGGRITLPFVFEVDTSSQIAGSDNGAGKKVKSR